MIAGLRGSLLSHDALLAGSFALVTPGDGLNACRSALTTWHRSSQGGGGPVWTARMVLDRVAMPVGRAFGLELVVRSADERLCNGSVLRGPTPVAAFVVFGWGREPAAGWRHGVLSAMDAGVRWCYCFTGPTLRIFDAARTHTRRFVELQLDLLARDEQVLGLAWNLLRGDDAGRGLDQAVAVSDRHRVGLRGALQHGVLDALVELTGAFSRALCRASRRQPPAALLQESLVIVYRVLFLLFAEARGLVPTWHPLYRDAYTIEALRDGLEHGRGRRGLWEALQAMARLAHGGCHAGALHVPPFNGRLFSPDHAPLAGSIRLDDEAVRRALLALTTRPTRSGRQRIAFSDLGVEHLGGVYERVLDFDVRTAGGSPRLVRGTTRKTTGSFYTPRSLTEYLVRRTLAPLVADASPSTILSLRVLDPSMGSGAFLVAACRYLASAYEEALAAEGTINSSEVTDADRAQFRRLVAQRTLFGVDRNPMAVQLARLSLWLATLCADRPLTFFDHHLRPGNSIVGARLADLSHVRSGRRRPLAPTPLLGDTGIESGLGEVVSTRLTLTAGREDTVDEVHRKETLLAALEAQTSPLGRLRDICDLWCAGWFDDGTQAPSRAAVGALLDAVQGRARVLTSAQCDRLVAHGRVVARREGFFHWELEFPEIFRGADGHAVPNPGFDAVLGNPPWEVLRGDAGESGARLTQFTRGSGAYRLQGLGHANLYQLFLERCLAVLRDGGRLGLVLPSGLGADQGSATLRRYLLDRTAIDTYTTVDNREALFPIHRGLRFVLLTTTANAGPTRSVPLRSGIHSALEFDGLPDVGPDTATVAIPRLLLEQFSGDQLVIPDLRTPFDLTITGRILASAPAAGCADGWGLRFGRELNATDDKAHFCETGGVPVIDGRHIQPFSVDVGACRRFLDTRRASALVRGIGFERARLAYRDVASATNRLTLIAAVLPGRTITTHTLFCLKTRLDEDEMHFVAGLFNSFVANYLARLRVTTHVTVAVAEALPLPRLRPDDSRFIALVSAARRLAAAPSDVATMARLQGLAARIYGLDPAQFAHVLSTFPLVDEALRRASLREYERTL